MELKEDCLFCKIIKGQIHAEKIYEDEKVLAFKDTQPQAKIHYLIVPKFHIESLAHLREDNTDVVKDLFSAANKIAKTEGFKKSGYRSVINTGADGGQSIAHLHLHILAGSKMGARFS